jgi:hypothetical protein
MKTDQKIISTTDAWESRELGADPTNARKVSPEIHRQIDHALGRFATAEMKSLLSGMAESQKKFNLAAIFAALKSTMKVDIQAHCFSVA